MTDKNFGITQPERLAKNFGITQPERLVKFLWKPVDKFHMEHSVQQIYLNCFAVASTQSVFQPAN
jgi:hypothetical protein